MIPVSRMGETMAVVVRCTGCRGASQVGPEAVGLMVVCPHCHEPFLAIEDAPMLKPMAPPLPASPSATPVRRPARARTVAEPVHAHVSSSPHEAPLPAGSGLPVSVLFGFALLPLAIPLLWLIGPILLTKPPSLTMAAPISLAISASVLCLAVVLTVDWAPMTRIKGVLILVGLSYFAGLSLYFLKKELVERIQDFLNPTERWQDFRDPAGGYTVAVPTVPSGTGAQPLAGWNLSCHECVGHPFPRPDVRYVFGSGPDSHADVEKWFEAVDRALKSSAGPQSEIPDLPAEVVSFENLPGRQWVINLPRDRTRVVRVFRTQARVYYLSVEGDDIDPDSHASVGRFFDSFRVDPPRK